MRVTENLRGQTENLRGQDFLSKTTPDPLLYSPDPLLYSRWTAIEEMNKNDLIQECVEYFREYPPDFPISAERLSSIQLEPIEGFDVLFLTSSMTSSKLDYFHVNHAFLGNVQLPRSRPVFVAYFPSDIHDVSFEMWESVSGNHIELPSRIESFSKLDYIKVLCFAKAKMIHGFILGPAPVDGGIALDTYVDIFFDTDGHIRDVEWPFD